jgi:two-component sensor histidine kinase
MEASIHDSPVAIALVRGADFRFERVNPAYAALAPEEPMVGRTLADVWPTAAKVLVPLLQQVRSTKLAHHDSSLAVGDRSFDFSLVPLAGDRIQVIATEVTARKRAEQELFAANQELAAIHANAPVALFLMDPDDCRPGDTLGCVNAVACPDGCGREKSRGHCIIRQSAADSISSGASRQNVEAWIQSRCLLVSTAPLGGKALICAQDITELKNAVRDLQAALAEKIVLFKEVHHRVKNNLAVITSLLRMKAEASANEDVRQALKESQERVHAMSLIHEQLCESDRLDRVQFEGYARQIVHELHRAFVTDPSRVAIETDLDPIEIPIEQAVPCGLILNELVTNAFKYAFEGERSGRVLVSLHCDGKGVELAIEDNGIGFSSLPPQGSSPSLGLRIVAILTHQLDGVLEHEPCDGTRIVLRFPVTRASWPARV